MMLFQPSKTTQTTDTTEASTKMFHDIGDLLPSETTRTVTITITSTTSEYIGSHSQDHNLVMKLEVN